MSAASALTPGHTEYFCEQSDYRHRHALQPKHGRL